MANRASLAAASVDDVDDVDDAEDALLMAMSLLLDVLDAARTPASPGGGPGGGPIWSAALPDASLLLNPLRKATSAADTWAELLASMVEDVVEAEVVDELDWLDALLVPAFADRNSCNNKVFCWFPDTTRLIGRS